MTGYLHTEYAASFSEYGRPRGLPRSGGWILERPIPDSGDRDAIGCYPLFACRDWSKLNLDLADLRPGLVSLTVVADPFGRYRPEHLKQAFPDLTIPFKQHYVLDLRRGTEPVSAHHKRSVRKALKTFEIDVLSDPGEFVEEFLPLYRTVVEKHGVVGIRAFSGPALHRQFRTPGIVVLAARLDDRAVAAISYFLQPEQDVVFGHVLGYTGEAYRRGALYALYWTAITHFAPRVRWCDIGGVAGGEDLHRSPLAAFKRGWTRETRTAYLCGRIFDRDKYERLRMTRAKVTGYFPAYRSGELL